MRNFTGLKVPEFGGNRVDANRSGRKLSVRYRWRGYAGRDLFLAPPLILVSSIRTAEGLWSDDSYFSDNMVNAYGLDALEHLTFADLDTECPSQVPPVSDGTVASLGG